MATRALNIPQLGAARIDRAEAATMIGLALSSALVAIGALVVALLTWVLVFVPHVTDSLADAGFRFAFHDDYLRRDALETLGFELSFAWLLTFLAILWWRGGVFRDLSNPQAGGHHGN
jgi:hypothetical protein